MKVWLEGRNEDLRGRWEKAAAFAREGWGPVILALGGIMVVALLWRLWTLPDAWFTFAYWGTHHEKIRNLGLVAAAVIGIPLLAWRTLSANTQARIATKGHLTDRFSKAVELLGNDKASVRVGGIYALEEVAREDPETYYTTVYEILCVLVKDLAYLNPREIADREEFGPPDSVSMPEQDIQAALAVIGRRSARAVKLNLTHTNLDGALLIEANLVGADFWKASLQMGELQYANLEGVDFYRAFLEKADFMYAHLGGANLKEARLEGADLRRVQGLTWPQLKQADSLPDDDKLPDNVLEEKRLEEAEAEG